jgi:hypothetical protein
MLTESRNITFSKHIRNRANTLINLLPFDHIHQNVLRAIAYIDWRNESFGDVWELGAELVYNQTPHQRKLVEDYTIYLQMARVTDDKSAAIYLDHLEPKMRRWMLVYDQMLEVHKHELKLLIAQF